MLAAAESPDHGVKECRSTALEAARAASLEDDIRGLPMEMRTVVPADGAGLSVGHRQRLLIARVFVRRPRVLLFDEATRALDNRAPAIVQASLTRLSADSRRDCPWPQLHPRCRQGIGVGRWAHRRERGITTSSSHVAAASRRFARRQLAQT